MRLLRPLLAATILGSLSCQSPQQQAAVQQALNDAATTVNGIEQDVTQLQDQVDSLRTVVARQDTVLRKLANLAHLPMP